MLIEQCHELDVTLLHDHGSPHLIERRRDSFGELATSKYLGLPKVDNGSTCFIICILNILFRLTFLVQCYRRVGLRTSFRRRHSGTGIIKIYASRFPHLLRLTVRYILPITLSYYSGFSNSYYKQQNLRDNHLIRLRNHNRRSTKWRRPRNTQLLLGGKFEFRFIKIYLDCMEIRNV